MIYGEVLTFSFKRLGVFTSILGDGCRTCSYLYTYFLQFLNDATGHCQHSYTVHPIWIFRKFSIVQLQMCAGIYNIYRLQCILLVSIISVSPKNSDLCEKYLLSYALLRCQIALFDQQLIFTVHFCNILILLHFKCFNVFNIVIIMSVTDSQQADMKSDQSVSLIIFSLHALINT